MPRHKFCYVLAPRSPHENLRVEDRSKKASRQLRGSSSDGAGLFCLGIGEKQDAHTILNMIRSRFVGDQYRGISYLMLIRTGTQLQPPQRTVVDLVATMRNPNSKFPFPNPSIAFVGASGRLESDVPSEGQVPAYYVADVEVKRGASSKEVVAPDLRHLTPEMLR